jgi:hypothetical protein
MTTFSGQALRLGNRFLCFFGKTVQIHGRHSPIKWLFYSIRRALDQHVKSVRTVLEITSPLTPFAADGNRLPRFALPPEGDLRY